MVKSHLRHLLRRNITPRRTFTSLNAHSEEGIHSRDFTFWPDFLTLPEQRILLKSSLFLLDSAESRQHQRWRKKSQVSQESPISSGQNTVCSLFLPDERYQFSEGHYDGVIRHFRERHVTSWPEAAHPGLRSIIDRVHALCPTPNVQTHLLHLASHGEILPHIDNVQASGSWILGVSLGAQRIMRMQNLKDERDTIDVLLSSGSVYLQRDALRFEYTHAILNDGMCRRQNGGQRLSLMIRDRLT